jgi:ABC-type multidrug transport system fused ATPase/permease subunit
MFAQLQAARTLVTARIFRRGVFLGGLVLVQRVLTSAAAWVLFARPVEVNVGVGLALAAVFTLRTFLQRALMSRTESELMHRAIGSVLDSDVLRGSVLPDDDAHADLAHGVYFAAHQLSEVLPALAGDLVAAILLGLVVVYIEPARLVLGAAALTAVAAGALMWSRGRLQRAVHRAWDLRDEVVQTMVDAVEGRLEIVASGGRDAFVTEAGERGHAWGVAGVRAASSSLLSGRAPLLAIALVVALAVTLGSRWHASLPVNLADVALFASVTPAFAGIAQGALGIAQMERSVHTVARIVAAARPRPNRGSRTLEESGPRTPIVFEDVSFRYEGAGTDALTDVAFTLRDERVVVVAGANGSGKSTCLRLLLALASPQRGVVRVGGIDVAELDADAWRSRIAFLPQRPYLPQRSDVRGAIRLLAPGVGDSRIRDALERVGLLSALARGREDPLATPVDQLSAGQRQRVALARVLCRDARLFVLDEPDANLDRAGIALVCQIVREVGADATVLLAAHAPEILELADRVVTLEDGRVASDEARTPGPLR